MGAAYFTMVLFGCAGTQDCAAIATMPVAYRSKAACVADQTNILSATGDLGYRRVFAECREQGRTSMRKVGARTGATA